MTTYNIDANKNDISAGNGTDFFQGPGGGVDSLRGNGGNDQFTIQAGQTGLIDGGSGYDRIHMVGGGLNDAFDTNLTITGVEELIMDAISLSTTVAQLKGFTHIGVNSEPDSFEISLRGAGGILDFSKSFTEPTELHVNAETTTAKVFLTGSVRNDEFIGSDFGDRLNGDKGVDTLRGGDGNDLINGGLGRDFLYGDDGKDAFVFDTALTGNYDHIGDFRPDDDSIRLDDAIFTALTPGALSASQFKMIGGGQTVDANDRILFNENAGVLYYDKDGTGGAAPIVFAVTDNFSGDVPLVTFQDFIIILGSLASIAAQPRCWPHSFR